jgi:DUF2075 family protein
MKNEEGQPNRNSVSSSEPEGYFAMQEHYLYRLNNFEECRVIDIFNIEFCESKILQVDQNAPYQLPGAVYSFEISKEEGKRVIQFSTTEKEDYTLWQQAFNCYIVGTGIHSYY